jgi:Holliday junction resolvasome RuvABC endonuclease subunit
MQAGHLRGQLRGRRLVRILGLDLSLQSTGYVLLEEDQVEWYGSIGSKELRDVERLEMFDEWIRGALHHSGNPFQAPTVEHVGIEGYSYGSHKSNLPALGELGGVMKLAVHKADVPIHVIAPGTWKKVLCGNGSLDKKNSAVELYKRYGVEYRSQDTLDAWAVAMCLRRQLLGLDKPERKSRKRKALPLLEEAIP